MAAWADRLRSPAWGERCRSAGRQEAVAKRPCPQRVAISPSTSASSSPFPGLSEDKVVPKLSRRRIRLSPWLWLPGLTVDGLLPGASGAGQLFRVLHFVPAMARQAYGTRQWAVLEVTYILPLWGIGRGGSSGGGRKAAVASGDVAWCCTLTLTSTSTLAELCPGPT
jgi:hypothetical protein